MRGLTFGLVKIAAVLVFVVFFTALAKVSQHSALAVWQSSLGFDTVSLMTLAPVLGFGAIIERRWLRPFLQMKVH